MKSDKQTEEGGKQKRVNMGMKYSGYEIKHVPTTYLQLGPTDHFGRYSPKQWMDYRTNKNNNDKHNVNTTGNMEKVQ